MREIVLDVLEKTYKNANSKDFSYIFEAKSIDLSAMKLDEFLNFVKIKNIPIDARFEAFEYNDDGVLPFLCYAEKIELSKQEELRRKKIYFEEEFIKNISFELTKNGYIHDRHRFLFNEFVNCISKRMFIYDLYINGFKHEQAGNAPQTRNIQHCPPACLCLLL